MILHLSCKCSKIVTSRLCGSRWLDRAMNEDFQNFVAYVGVSDTLIEQATKEEIAEVARVLALHVAHYRQR